MRILGLSVALSALIACGGKHPGAYEVEAPAASSDTSAASGLLADASARWEARSDDAAMAESLALYEKVLAADPSNREALQMLTRGWYFYGDAYTTDVDVQLERWSKAITYGTKCLALNGDIAEAIKAGEKEKDAIAAATVDDVPCIYWTASALGKWGKAQSLSTTLKHLPTVKAYISKVEDLDPTYWYYGPARYWGAYYAALPSFAGRDLDASVKNLEVSMNGAPTYLGTKVLRSEFTAVTAQDPNAFLTYLYEALQSDPYATPEITPENLKEQAKARRLLEQRSELFEKDALAAALTAHPIPEFPTFTPPAAPAAVERPEGEPASTEPETVGRPDGEPAAAEPVAVERPDAEATEPGSEDASETVTRPTDEAKEE
jgi:tetratricopeptide (TPR) repeat protein